MSGASTEAGRLQPWPMGFKHFFYLNSIAEFIGNSCATCGTRDCLEWQVWQCGNPDCGHPIIRKSTTTYNPKQIKEISEGLFNCQQCGLVSYLQELVACAICVQRGLMPQRASIFDVDMSVRKEKSQDSTTTALLIPAYSDPRPITPPYDKLAVPIDLPARFRATPLDVQETMWKYTPPQTQQAPAQPANPHDFYTQYGQQPRQS